MIGAPGRGRVAAPRFVVTLVMAGHETTAATLTWALAFLLGQPAALGCLADELRRVVGGGPILPEHVDQLEYLDAAVREVMRLRPVVPLLGVGRLLKQPLCVQGFELPAGVKLVPLIYATHRRPDLYPEPERFAPERFVGKKIDPYAWLPFGGGVRRCIGAGFSLMEGVAVLREVLRVYDVALPAGPADYPRVRNITSVPRHGARIVVTAR